jgi:hypothetical protein
MVREMAELFEQFEVDRVPRWPMLARLLGGSIVLHFIMLACVLYVPAVRDALNIAAMYSDTNMVSRDYKKTNIEDRAQILNLPKFQYPEGYFAQAAPTPDPFSGMIVQTAPPMGITPPVMMPKMPNVKQTPPPVPSPSASPSPSVDPKDPAAALAATGKPKTADEAEAELTRVAAEGGVGRPSDEEVKDDFNNKPFKDWAKRVNDLKLEGKLDLNKPLDITIITDFDENGKLKGTPLVSQKSGDPILTELAKELVAAMIDSNLMKFLKDPKTKRLETRQLVVHIMMNDQEVVASVKSDAASEERAQQLSKTYNDMLKLGVIVRSGKDEGILMKNAKVTSEGKQLIINFAMPRQEATEMIKKQLPPAT